MKLNDIKAAPGSRPAAKRPGRGISAGGGKTCGRGMKGQHSRSGGYHKVGFEGGQMPLQRRLPKVGFNSPSKGKTAQVRLHELALLPEGEPIDLAALKRARIIGQTAEKAKVILSGKLDRAVTLKPGIAATKGAAAAIEAAGGTIEN